MTSEGKELTDDNEQLTEQLRSSYELLTRNRLPIMGVRPEPKTVPVLVNSDIPKSDLPTDDYYKVELQDGAVYATSQAVEALKNDLISAGIRALGGSHLRKGLPSIDALFEMIDASEDPLKVSACIEQYGVPAKIGEHEVLDRKGLENRLTAPTQ